MSEVALAKTPLHALHVELGAKMVPFAGYSMPVQYPGGILQEHLHTRAQAGLFDVSHMGQIWVRGDGIAEALETLVPADIVGLPAGCQRYALLTNEAGGIRDDLMIARLEDGYLLVVNAACKDSDFKYIKESIGNRLEVEMDSERALLALQGPAARIVMQRLSPAASEMVFMDVACVEVAGFDCIVSCSGYTGEDGFEISVAADRAEALARLLLEQPEVGPVGLGARDSLRLEAGLCLYGHDINSETSVVEAGLSWSIGAARRPDGVRAGGYPGAEIVAEQLNAGTVRRRVMLSPEGRAPVREGAELEAVDGHGVGVVTSGGFGPSLGSPVAMGYVDSDVLDSGQQLVAKVRGKLLPVKVVQGALIPSRYVRKRV